MFATLSVAALAASLQLSAPDIAKPRGRLVVKEVVLARPFWGGADFLWWFNHSQGDINADGKSDNILFGVNSELPGGDPDGGRELAVLMNGVKGADSASYNQPWLQPQRYLLNPSGWKTPITTALNSPVGVLLVGLERSPERYTMRKLEDGRLVGEFTAPPPPPGYPPIFSIQGIFRAPDVTLDGWEELFFQATADSYAVCGLIDGRTQSALWMHYEPWYGGFAPIFLPDYGRRGDLDGDGVPDFLFGYARRVQNPWQPWLMRIAAVSGSTGARIWATEFGDYPNCGFGGVDHTGDGVDDLVAASANQVTALDGRDGRILWARDVSEFDHLLENSYGIVPYFAELSLITRWPGTNDRLVGMASIRHGQLGSNAEHHLYIALDLQSGALVQAQYPPATLEPWTPEGVEVHQGSGHHFCGDVDGDGYQEFARVIPAPLWDSPNSWQPARHLVYFGPETLFLAESSALAEEIRGSVSLPAAAGCDYRMIASLEFDPELGVVHDGYPTHLVRDRVFNHFLGRNTVHGVLDAQGAASFSLRIPDDPLLRGQTLHLRVLATPPGDPWSLKTMSTVARVRIRN